jgi:hypothetical protein
VPSDQTTLTGEHVSDWEELTKAPVELVDVIFIATTVQFVSAVEFLPRM